MIYIPTAYYGSAKVTAFLIYSNICLKRKKNFTPLGHAIIDST